MPAVSEAAKWVALGNVGLAFVSFVSHHLLAEAGRPLVRLQDDDKRWHIVHVMGDHQLHYSIMARSVEWVAMWFAAFNLWLSKFWAAEDGLAFEALSVLLLALSVVPWVVLIRITGDCFGCGCSSSEHPEVQRRLRETYVKKHCKVAVIPTLDFVILFVGYAVPVVLAASLG